MNAATDKLGLKILTDVVPDSSKVDGIVLVNHDKSEAGEPEAIQEIHARAETMTSLLKGILDFHPTTHWGINE